MIRPCRLDDDAHTSAQGDDFVLLVLDELVDDFESET